MGCTGEDCVCSDGRSTWAPTQTGAPTYDGCGSSIGFPWHIPSYLIYFASFRDGFQAACNAHDMCYDTCGATRGSCDAAFCSGLHASCPGSDWPAVCARWASKYCSAVTGNGAAPFNAAKRAKCGCARSRADEERLTASAAAVFCS